MFPKSFVKTTFGQRYRCTNQTTKQLIITICFWFIQRHINILIDNIFLPKHAKGIGYKLLHHQNTPFSINICQVIYNQGLLFKRVACPMAMKYSFLIWNYWQTVWYLFKVKNTPKQYIKNNYINYTWLSWTSSTIRVWNSIVRLPVDYE